MFNKLKAKAGQPLTYGWLWKCYAGELVVAGLFYGGIWLYGRLLEKKANEETETAEVDYNEFENEED